MKKYIVIIVTLFCFIACKNKTASVDDTKSNNEASSYKLGDLPNKNTDYDTLIGNNDTSKISEDVNNLIAILKKDKFTVKTNKQLQTPLNLYLYEENRIIILKDVSTFKLFARSIISDKRMKNTFPDFTLYEMNFKNDHDAEMVLKWFEEERRQRVTEKIDVDKIFSKTNKVYYLTTRAEMFRNYIDMYSYFIKTNP